MPELPPSTHEAELTAPVDLCTPGGRALNPAARGWSRFPLHRTNLAGHPGRNKQWDYWAVLAGDVVVSAVFANIDYLAFADVWWADLTTGASGGGATVGDPADYRFPERVGGAELRVDENRCSLALVDAGSGTRLEARWLDRTGVEASFVIDVAQPPDHESVNVVIPWSAEEFNFTSKHQARPATGELRVGAQKWEIGGAAGDAWGVLDVGRGRWPAEIRWNWGGGAGRCDGHVIGLQIGGKWTAGTGFTENGVIVDGRLTKLGSELLWEYDWDHPLEPWRVTDPAGRLAMTLMPRYDKHTVLGDPQDPDDPRQTHQVFGTWSGFLVTEDDVRLDFGGIQGFAEEARQQW
ncbi:MAG: DUF2804 domain-containing protein [Actinomycetota bacterium]